MKVRELFTDESKWTQGHAARNEKGERVWYKSPEACCWCLVGAINKCYVPAIRPEIFEKISDYINSRAGISVWNDAPERTFAEVKALVEKLDI